MRRSSIVLALLGVLCIAAAAVIRFAVVPSATALPTDLDTTVHYAGKGSLLSTQALTAGDVSKALAKDIDVTIDRHVKVTKTEGDTAVIHDDSTLKAAGQSIEDNHIYAIDRKTLTEAPAPSGEKVEAHTGITIALPVDPKADNSYKYYDPPTGTSAEMKYVGTDNKGGREVYHYTAEATGPVKDPVLTSTLPPVLPRTLAVKMLSLLPPQVQQAFQAAAASLPELIPLTYTVTSKYDFYADTTVGAPVDSALERKIVASTTLGGQQVPLLAVLDVKVTQTPASVTELADQASSNANKLNLLNIWLPVALVVIGVLLIVVAVIRRRPAATAGAAPAGTQPEPDAPGSPTEP